MKYPIYFGIKMHTPFPSSFLMTFYDLHAIIPISTGYILQAILSFYSTFSFKINANGGTHFLAATQASLFTALTDSLHIGREAGPSPHKAADQCSESVFAEACQYSLRNLQD